MTQQRESSPGGQQASRLSCPLALPRAPEPLTGHANATLQGVTAWSAAPPGAGTVPDDWDPHAVAVSQLERAVKKVLREQPGIEVTQLAIEGPRRRCCRNPNPLRC
jgi:hypothetical protein